MNFSELVREHHALVYRTALGVLRSPDLAEDAAQDVFIGLLERPSALADVTDMRAFLARCAFNRALSRRKRQQVRERHEVHARGGTMEVEPADWVFRRELRARVDALPEDERAAVDLHYFQGLTLSQAASALQVSDRTVSTRLRTALETLRRIFAGSAFLAMLADLEGELRACEPVPIPAGLERRLQALRPGNVVPGPLARRSPAGRLVAGGFALVAILGMLSGLALRRFGSGPGESLPGVVAGVETAPDGGPVLLAAGGTPTEGPRAGDVPPAVEPLSGQVVDPSGRPVAGATVEALPPDGSRRGSAARAGGPSRMRATTDADGEFRIALATGEVADIEAAAEGFSTGWFRSVSAGERIRLVLERGASLTIRVRDSESRPVARARVIVIPEGAGDLPWASGPGARGWQKRPDTGGGDVEGTTDEAGECTVTGLRRDVPCGVHATAQGFEEGHLRVTLSGSGSEIADLILTAGCTARGRVLDAVSGRPIAGALVRKPWDPSFATLRGDDAAAVRTGEDGSFEFPGWPRNDPRVPLASATGYWPRPMDRVGAETFEVRLAPAPRITGRVVTPDRRPVFPATVSTPEDSSSVDRDGRFAISIPEGDLREGYFFLTAQAPGLGRGTLRLPYSIRDIDAGDLVIPANHALRGRLVTRAGLPVPRGLIALGTHEGLGLSVRTDDRGRFAFRDVPEGEWFLEAHAEGIGSVECFVLVPQTPGGEIEILLPPTRALTVTVVTEDGAAVPDLLVSASFGVPEDDLWERPFFARTGPDGAAALEIGGTSSAVRIGLAERLPAGFLAVPDRILQGPTAAARIVLRRGGTLTGTVVDAAGRPVPCREVAAVLGDREEVYSTSPAADGRFELTAPPGVEVTLEVAPVTPWNAPATSFRHRFPGFRAGEADARLVVALPAADSALTVRVLLPDGTPARDALVVLGREGADLRDAEGAASARTDTRGEARFVGLTPDRIVGIARPGRNTPHGPSGQVTLVPGGTVELRLSPEK